MLIAIIEESNGGPEMLIAIIEGPNSGPSRVAIRILGHQGIPRDFNRNQLILIRNERPSGCAGPARTPAAQVGRATGAPTASPCPGRATKGTQGVLIGIN